MQENISSKKLNLGLNFSTSIGGVTGPSLKGSIQYTLRGAEARGILGVNTPHFLEGLKKWELERERSKNKGDREKFRG